MQMILSSESFKIANKESSFNVRDIADMIGYSVSYTYDLSKNGILPPFKMYYRNGKKIAGQNKHYISKIDFLQWIKNKIKNDA